MSKRTWLAILLAGWAGYIALLIVLSRMGPQPRPPYPGAPAPQPSIVGQVVVGIVTYPVVVCVIASLIALAYAVLPVQKVPFVYNLRNLQIRWKTTAITALAFTLVVAILSVMLAFVFAMYRMTQESGVPGNVMVLSDGATDEAFSNLPGNVAVEELPSDLQAGVSKDETGKFMAVKEVYVIVTQQVNDQGKRRFIQMRGVDSGEMAAKVHNIKLQPGGSWFSPSGVKTIGKNDTAYEIVLGAGIAQTLGQDVGKPSIAVGDLLEIGPRKWVVVGIMDPSGSAFGNEIWARDQHVAENYGRRNSYSSYVLRTKDEPTAKLATKLLKDFRGGISMVAFTEKEYYEKLSQTNQQFLTTFIFISIVMAVGGVLGVMNTMFAAIAQRTKDIGVLRLIGYTRAQILMSFLLESLVIAVLGGLLGCAAGYLLADGYTATSIISSGAGGGGKTVALKLLVTPAILGIGMFFAFLMGSIGGLVPALSATRRRPL